MKNFLTRILLAMSVFVLATSCSDDDTPQKVLTQPVPAASNITKTSFEVSWNAVDNATAYTYTVNDGAEQTTRDLSVTVTDLSPNTAYTFKVKAVDENGEWKESPVASLTVTTEDGPLTEFSITPSDITAYTVRLAIAPSDPAAYYWFTLISEEEKNNAETSVAEILQNDLTYFINRYTNPDNEPDKHPDFNLTIKAMLDKYGAHGSVSGICPVRKKKALKPGTKYYVAAAYVDSETGALLSTPVVVEGSEFTTLVESLPHLEAKMALGNAGNYMSSWVRIEWQCFGGKAGKFLVSSKVETEAMLAKGYTYESLVDEFGVEVRSSSFTRFDEMGTVMDSNYDDCTERTEYIGMLVVGNDQGKLYWHGEISTEAISDDERLFPTTITDITGIDAKAIFSPKNPTDYYWLALVSDQNLIGGITPYIALVNERNSYVNRNSGMTINDIVQKFALHGNQTLELSTRFGALLPGTRYRLAVSKIDPQTGNLKGEIELYYFTTAGASTAPSMKTGRLAVRHSKSEMTER